VIFLWSACVRGIGSFACAICALALVPASVSAAPCPPGALGTSRTLTLHAKDRIGIGHGYPALGLAHGEIILTFDDGPMPDTTPQILDTLAKDCIKATFFMIGKRADAHPEIAAQVRAAGHSIGSHSYSHRELNHLPFDDAARDIEHGYEAVEKAVYGSAAERPRLVRFPDFKSTPQLVDFVHAHDGIVVNTNISPADWKGQPAEVTFDRLKALFDRQDRGIVILHDSQKNTVKLLPMVIAEMKARHMRIVHLAVE
jgi:peptidoglycan/xylan/chitin deacetylase (PgdA/CDA1 family)